MNCAELVEQLAEMGSESDRAGMARFGINADKAFGIRIPELRKVAKAIGKDEHLAIDLWQTGLHEARLLATFIFPAAALNLPLMEQWVKDFDSWDVCDQACSLFSNHPQAFDLAVQWSYRGACFEKRAGFSLMAWLAVHQKAAPDTAFLAFFPAITAAATDERNFVKKAVNWALRQIGKRNISLHKHAITTAEALLATGNKTALWIARDALRELTEPGRIEQISQKSNRKTARSRTM